MPLTSKYFPWSVNGPLCPVLRRVEVWEQLLGDKDYRRLVKRVCRRVGFAGIGDSATLWKTFLVAMDSPRGRTALAKASKSEGFASLATILFVLGWVTNKPLKQAWPLEDLWNRSNKTLRPLEVSRLTSWLSSQCYNKGQVESIATVACAFAMVQPSDAQGILEALIRHDANFAELLCGPKTEAVPEVVAAKTKAGAAEPSGPACEDRIGERDGEQDPAGSVCAETSANTPEGQAVSSDLLDLTELEKAAGLLQSFLTAHDQMHEFLKRLPSLIRNLACQGVTPAEGLENDFHRALDNTLTIGSEVDRWLSLLSERLRSSDATAWAQAEPGLETVRIQVTQPRGSIDLLRNACEEVGKLLPGLIEGVKVRDEGVRIALIEIAGTDGLLGLASAPAPAFVPTGNLLKGLELKREVDARLAAKRAEKAAFLLARKTELLAQAKVLAERYDASALEPTLAAEFRELRDLAERVEGSESLTAAQKALERLEASMRSRPEARNLQDLVKEATSGLPTADKVLPVVRALTTRGRATEALALLTCLQLSTEVESCGPADFSCFTEELMRAAAELPDTGAVPLAWIDALFKQPWIKVIVRADIDDRLTWMRLGVAFVVLEHLRGTEQEIDLFYALEFQKAWPNELYPALGRLLRGIATRQHLRIQPEALISKRQEVEGRVLQFFRKDDHGDYMRQAARGDNFHTMERYHLFPKLEEIHSTVRRHCDSREWELARNAIQLEPDRLLRRTCQEARIDAVSSSYFRRLAVGPTTGYIPEFLREMGALIDAAMDAGPGQSEFVLLTDLMQELTAIANQQAGFENFWASVRRSLVSSPSERRYFVNSGAELLVELFNRFGAVAALSPSFVAALCVEGPARRADCDNLVQMITTVGSPVPDCGLRELEEGKCYQHAVMILEQFGSQVPKRLLIEDLATVETRLRRELSEIREDLTRRLHIVESHSEFESRAEACQQAVTAGYFRFADREVAAVEGTIARALDARRAEVDHWVRGQLDRLSKVKRAATAAERPEAWLESAFTYCGQVERVLLLAQGNAGRGRPFNLSQETVESAITALAFIMENDLQTFEEVEHHIAALVPQKPAGCPPAEPAEIAIPEIASLWEKLRAMVSHDPREVGACWEAFACKFAKMCLLYHELHESLQFSAVRGYQWGRYVTRFYDPRSGWLDREIRLYLCFGNYTTAEALEPLLAELENNPECINLVFLPNGIERVARIWKPAAFGAPYTLIGEAVLAKICGAIEKHHVPLRQAVHRGAPKLSAIGLFKSEGYVHMRKNLFVGRVQALQQLIQRPASAIWGGRRTGKTSLLQALSDRLKRANFQGPGSQGEPYKVAMVYAHKVTGDPDLAIAKRIGEDLGLGDFGNIDEFESRLIGAASQQRIAILIDEADSYIERSREIHGEGAFPLARVLRGVSQRDSTRRFKLVYAGFKQLFYEVRMKPSDDPSYPFKNILEPVAKDFQDLTGDEVLQLMTIGFVEMLGVEWDAAVPRLVKSRTSGHPAFVQRFCELLLVRLSKRREFESSLKITKEDVDDVYNEQTPLGADDHPFIDYVSETLGWNVSHLERAILLALSTEIRYSRTEDSRSFSADEIMEQLKDWCDATIPAPSESDFRNSLKMLSMTKMLTVEGTERDPRFRITYAAYIDFMSRLDKIGRVEIFKSLRDYDKEERGLIK